jgi:membrane protein YdbS with pleckstrin-like domain
MLFSFKPVFIGWIALLMQLPLQLFLTIWSGGFFGGTTSFLFPNSRAQFFFFGALAFFGIPLVAYVGKKLNYARSEYKFFGDRLEFEEGFFSLSKKVIRLRDIKEVTLRKGLFQRQYGLGSIYLATQATGTWGSWGSTNAFTAMGFGSISASGVILRDISTPDDAYQKISELIEKNR